MSSYHEFTIFEVYGGTVCVDARTDVFVYACVCVCVHRLTSSRVPYPPSLSSSHPYTQHYKNTTTKTATTATAMMMMMMLHRTHAQLRCVETCARLCR